MNNAANIGFGTQYLWKNNALRRQDCNMQQQNRKNAGLTFKIKAHFGVKPVAVHVCMGITTVF